MVCHSARTQALCFDKKATSDFLKRNGFKCDRLLVVVQQKHRGQHRCDDKLVLGERLGNRAPFIRPRRQRLYVNNVRVKMVRARTVKKDTHNLDYKNYCNSQQASSAPKPNQTNLMTIYLQNRRQQALLLYERIQHLLLMSDIFANTLRLR